MLGAKCVNMFTSSFSSRGGYEHRRKTSIVFVSRAGMSPVPHSPLLSTYFQLNYMHVHPHHNLLVNWQRTSSVTALCAIYCRLRSGRR